jgi:hypothetical protein
MRRLIFAIMLLAATVSSAPPSTTTLAASIRLPLSPAFQVLAPHPLVGSWEETTTDGVVPMVFGADGAVTMQFPDTTLSSHGTSFVSGGAGTWEPVGTQGATYTVVRLVSHANGINLGTITIQGYLVLSADGSTFRDDGQLTVVTTRNAKGVITSVTGLSATTPPSIATRVVAAPAASTAPSFEAHGANLPQRD